MAPISKRITPRSAAALLALLLTSALPTDHAAADTTWYAYRGQPRYRNLYINDPTNDSKLLPINLNNRWGLADQRGYIIARPRFDWTDYGDRGLARAIADGRTGFILGDGDWFIQPRFQWVDRFVESYAVFRERGRYGFIDRRGEVVLPPNLEGALRFRDKTAAAMLDGKVGFLDRSFAWTIPPQFAVARSFHDGYAAVQFFAQDGQPGRWGFIDRRGKPVWTDDTDTLLELGDFNDGRAKALVKNTGPDGEALWGYLNKRFRFEIDPQFRSARDFTNHVAAVEYPNRGWGFISRNGNWEIEPTFDDADDFDTRLAMIRHQGKYGYIDRAGKTGIYPQFDRAEPFRLGFARVSREESFAYISPTATVLWDPLLPLENRSRRGLTDRTAGAQFRKALRTGPTPNPYQFHKLPRWQPQATIPYHPEHLYEERLPPPPRGGLLPPPAHPSDDENKTPPATQPGDYIRLTEPTETLRLDP